MFHSSRDSKHVKEKLEEVYPKLKLGGGFEILRSTSNFGSLFLIDPLSCGYSVKFLKEEAGLGQAVAYIRPIQRMLTSSLAKKVGPN